MHSANEDWSSIVEELDEMISKIEERLDQEWAAIVRIKKEMEERQ
jgi:hypothetical protein